MDIFGTSNKAVKIQISLFSIIKYLKSKEKKKPK